MSPYLTRQRAQVPVRKFQARLPTGCHYSMKIFLPPLFVGVLVRVCVEVWPAHTTEPTSPLRVHVSIGFSHVSGRKQGTKENIIRCMTPTTRPEP